jgi:multiple sugar transport system substrate-binding protein
VIARRIRHIDNRELPMKIKTIALSGAMLSLMSTVAFAQSCGPEGQSIRILASDFPAIQAVMGAAEEACSGSAAEFTRNHTTEARDIMNAALTPNPAEYTSVQVANSSLTQLMNDGLLRPLNDLIAEYGQNIPDNLKITIGGDVMAIAFMANSQHLFVRTDVLEEAGITEIPTTYAEVLAAAEAIRAAGIMEHPIVANMQVGWNIAEMFNTVYMAYDGSFFEPGSAVPAVNSEAGIATLEMMASLAEYAHPDHLSQASNETQATWEAGQAALGFMWGSRGSVILDDEGSTAEVTDNTLLTAAPVVDGIGIPGATLWWDGFTVAANVSDEEAAASFAALASALTPEMVMAHNDDAVWLLEGFEPGAAAAGVSATAQAGARPYPMVPQMGLLHNALGAELSDFMQGNESAEQALADVVAAYTTAATEAGFLTE